MSIKQLARKLAKARDEIVEKQEISPEIEKTLEALLFDSTKNDDEDIFAEPKTLTGRVLTADQHYRLRLIEKTGTGSSAIH